jgi:hypothetical protein
LIPGFDGPRDVKDVISKEHVAASVAAGIQIYLGDQQRDRSSASLDRPGAEF